MNEVSKFHVTGINQKQLNKAVQIQFTGGYSQEYSEEKTLKKKSFSILKCRTARI